jgi:hypothetical protein
VAASGASERYLPWPVVCRRQGCRRTATDDVLGLCVGCLAEYRRAWTVTGSAHPASKRSPKGRPGNVAET